jgi:hypothetical protein
MYADDSTIHISGKNISDIPTKVQEDLNRIELYGARIHQRPFLDLRV